jgi:hypothetical protein
MGKVKKNEPSEGLVVGDFRVGWIDEPEVFVGTDGGSIVLANLKLTRSTVKL